MKKSMLTFGVAVLSIAGMFAFKPTTQTSITGKVTPAEGAETVWAINGTDSTKAAISSGAFAFDVKPGIYTVVVDANEPYKDVTLENLEVKEAKPVDVGEIVLQK
ncbi:MAG: carboxypeptidase regulatory-like domain-containing protein [Chitinophagaceae bacterium]